MVRASGQEIFTGLDPYTRGVARWIPAVSGMRPFDVSFWHYLVWQSSGPLWTRHWSFQVGIPAFEFGTDI